MTGISKVKNTDEDIVHYSVFHLDGKERDPDAGMQSLRTMFPTGAAINQDNFVLFGTSGVHGSYATIDDLEEELKRFGDDFDPGDDEPDGWIGDKLTVLIIKSRTVTLYYGNVRVRLADIPYLREIQAASKDAILVHF